MKTIGDVANGELTWQQPSALKESYELGAGGEVVAVLRFERSTLASAEADGARWTFKREGFWHQRVTVRTAGSDLNEALFRPHFGGGGELQTADGKVFQLSSGSFLRGEWIWQQGDHVLVTFRRGGLVKAHALVEIAAEAVQLTELPLLVVLGWYLILLHGRDVAAATAGTSAARVVVMR